MSCIITHCLFNLCRAYTVPNSRPFWDATPIDCSQAESCLTECWLSLPTATVTTGGCGGQAMLLQCGETIRVDLLTDGTVHVCVGVGVAVKFDISLSLFV